MLLDEYRLAPRKPEAQQFLAEQAVRYFVLARVHSFPKKYVSPKQ